jgi:hypothetical protein
MLAHTFRPFLLDASEEGVTAADVIPDSGPWSGDVDGETYCQPTFAEAVTEIEYAIERRLLATLSYGLLLHAAAVADATRQIVLLGPRFAGKTTIAMELVRRGWVYMGDEYVVFDEAGTTLYPFPKSAVLREIVGELPPGTHIDLTGHPEQWSYCMPDNRSSIEPVPVTDLCFIVPNRRAAGRANAQKLPTRATLAELFKSAYDFPGHETVLWPALSTIAVGSRACAFDYSDIEELDVVLEFLGGM